MQFHYTLCVLKILPHECMYIIYFMRLLVKKIVLELKNKLSLYQNHSNEINYIYINDEAKKYS